MIHVGVSPARLPVDDPVELDISLTNNGAGTCSRVIFTVGLPGTLGGCSLPRPGRAGGHERSRSPGPRI